MSVIFIAGKNTIIFLLAEEFYLFFDVKNNVFIL